MPNGIPIQTRPTRGCAGFGECSSPNGNANGSMIPMNGKFVPRSILRSRTPSPAIYTATQEPPGDGSRGDGVTFWEKFLYDAGVYFAALRPWSFPASMTPVGLGSCLAYRQTGDFSVCILLVTCLTVLVVHGAGNLVNTYYDYTRGVDTMKSDDRLLVDGKLTPSQVASYGGFLYLTGCIGLFLLIVLSQASVEQLSLVFFGGLSSSFIYTGGLGLKYIALGDVIVLFTFGPLAVLFAFVTQTGTLSWLPLVYAIPLSLNTEAILHSNNTRDIKADMAVGIVTLPILIDRTASYLLFVFLIFTPYVVFAVMAIHASYWFVLPLATVVLSFKYERLFRRCQFASMPQSLALLNLQLGLLYIVACLLSDIDNLPGFS